MSNRQAQIPGGAYFNDAEEAVLYQRQVPGGMYVNETQESGAAPSGQPYQKRLGGIPGMGIVQPGFTHLW
jgi:hypothetical protein